jgi:hypothetical protein
VTAIERALLEQIAFLEAELERVRQEQAIVREAQEDDSPINYALRDPNFRQWLLKKQLEARP